MIHHVIICGGRNYNDRRTFYNVLDEHVSRLRLSGWVHLHHGNAAGADRMTDDWVAFRAKPKPDVTRYPARWDELGRSAGPRRNSEMLSAVIALAGAAEVVTVIAFPGGKGTAHMTRIARAHKCMVIEPVARP